MLRSFVVGAIAATGAVVLTPACADNNSSLFITAVLYRKAPTCTIIADPTSETLGGGILDFAFTKSYDAALLVGNQLTSRGSKETLRTETSRVTLRGAEIKVTTADGTTLNDFSVNGTGFVDVSRGEDSGFGIFDTELIPSSVGTQLLKRLNDLKIRTKSTSLQTSDQVVAHVKVFGNTLGGQDITSSELSFPITYCEGCLIDFPLSAIDVLGNGNATCTKDTTDIPIPGCRVGQDDLIDCRACASTNPLCHDVDSTSAGLSPSGGADAGP
ncbi:MAG TPA: hypothetical protein VH062_03450 [Polyangiaceae bacterium]|nr:hypothetical protein [Polyangiaceae bacterium]